MLEGKIRTRAARACVSQEAKRRHKYPKSQRLNTIQIYFSLM